MADTISPTTGRRYGIARVCRLWAVPRSLFYAARRGRGDPRIAKIQFIAQPRIVGANYLAPFCGLLACSRSALEDLIAERVISAASAGAAFSPSQQALNVLASLHRYSAEGGGSQGPRS